MGLLEFHNVSYVQGNKTILHKLNVSIDPGDYITIVGPSGSGKSTFLKLCSQLISPSEGNIHYRGKLASEYNPVELRRSIAYVFQTPWLFGSTVLDNISFPFTIRNLKVDMQRTTELFSMFCMDVNYLEQKVLNLSGGEKQRIALIRTLLFQPEILLLDEVTSALDHENTLLVEQVVQNLNGAGCTVLWVTHNVEQSRRYANKLLTIRNGEIDSMEVLR